jgi:hypothetical protein
MRLICIALVVVAGAAGSAHADGPIVINAGLGMNMPVEGRSPVCYSDHASTYRPVLNLDIAYRLIDQFAAGIHLGARSYPWEDCGGNIPGSYQRYRGVNTALELGVVANWSVSRFWLTVWLGIEDGEAPYGGRHPAIAVGAGVDVYIHPSGHRVGVYLDLTSADGAYDADKHVSAGIAYRYW